MAASDHIRKNAMGSSLAVEGEDHVTLHPLGWGCEKSVETPKMTEWRSGGQMISFSKSNVVRHRGRVKIRTSGAHGIQDTLAGDKGVRNWNSQLNKITNLSIFYLLKPFCCRWLYYRCLPFLPLYPRNVSISMIPKNTSPNLPHRIGPFIAFTVAFSPSPVSARWTSEESVRKDSGMKKRNWFGL